MKKISIKQSDTTLWRAIILSLGSIIGVGIFVLFLCFAIPYLQSFLSFSFALFVRFCDFFGYANLILSFLSAWAIMTYVVLREIRSGIPQEKFAVQYKNIAYFVAAIMVLNIFFIIGYNNSSLPSGELRVAGVFIACISIFLSVFFCLNILDKIHDHRY